MSAANESITLGLWPIAGVTTVGVTQDDARETIATAIEVGITSFDTAFSYGYDGESDRYLGAAIGGRRDDFKIISKVGQRWDAQRKRIIDCRPKTLIADAETCLRRIGIERLDTLMLHCPDPNVEVEHSAEAIEQLRQRGLCERIGVCNVNAEQQQRFASVAGCDAIQCPLNLIQRDSLNKLIPQCSEQSCEVYAFWVLMKGLLAGSITRDHVFAEGDSRPNYEIFQGEQRRRTHDLLDAMQQIGNQADLTIAQLSIGWALSQSGVTSVLIGARRPAQIKETATASTLPTEIVNEVEAARSRTFD